MKLNIFFPFLLLLILFVNIGCNNFNTKKEPAYIGMSDRIFNKYINDMEFKYSLFCFGRGGGFLDQVNEICVSFNCIGPLDREELRELLVVVTEDLLKRYNVDEEIRPFLKNYPFTAANCSISIYLVDRNGKLITNLRNDKIYLSSVYMYNGIVTYDIINEEKVASQEVYRETYEEALSILKSTKWFMFRDPSARLVVNSVLK